MILIVCVALWFAGLLCGSSHRVESNEANPWLVWMSGWWFLFSVIVLNPGMWFFFFLWMWEFLQIAIFHWYVTISSPAFCLVSLPPWIWKETAILEPNEGNGCFLMLTSGIAFWPASGEPYSVTLQTERRSGRIDHTFTLFHSPSFPMVKVNESSG